VLTVLYLIYDAGADDTRRRGLRAEAIWLTRVLVGLMVTPECRPAATQPRLCCCRTRTGPWGTAPSSPKARELVLACLRRRSLGPFQLQAAIQALHCAAVSYEETDWAAIVRSTTD
jgi:RNA polymerase sigma-70 factor (ECF subfamily)